MINLSYLSGLTWNFNLFLRKDILVHATLHVLNNFLFCFSGRDKSFDVVGTLWWVSSWKSGLLVNFVIKKVVWPLSPLIGKQVDQAPFMGPPFMGPSLIIFFLCIFVTDICHVLDKFFRSFLDLDQYISLAYLHTFTGGLISVLII